MADTFSGFALNYLTQYYFGLKKESLLKLGGGITTAETDFDEDTDDVAYYDGAGSKETISQGKSFPFNFEGNRKYGDEVQEIIRDMLAGKVSNQGYLRVIEPDGRILQGLATVTGVTPFGGDALERSTMEFTISFNGTPEDLVVGDADYPTDTTPAPEA